MAAFLTPHYVRTRQHTCPVALNLFTLGTRPGEWMPSYFSEQFALLRTERLSPHSQDTTVPLGDHPQAHPPSSLAPTPRAGWDKLCCGLLCSSVFPGNSDIIKG